MAPDRAEARELVLLPALRARRRGADLLLTRKYMDGVHMLAERWPGPVTTLFELSGEPSTEMDLTPVPSGRHGPVQYAVRPQRGTELVARLRSAAVVLAFLSPFELGLTRICRAHGIPLVLTSEYTLKTELQIVRAQKLSRLRTLRRTAWHLQAEATRRIMVPRVNGLQCSGTPTYDAYRGWARNRLLFFDNRVLENDVVSERDLEARLVRRRASSVPIRLVFGGRFVAMKGVLELPRVAAELARRGVAFSLDIVGDGPLRAELLADLERRGVADRVEVHPPMDFRSGWIPWLRDHADLFVCCHPQGDPSSTYPEVMSCGVPIVGYGNEAFLGIVRESGSGWVAPLGDVPAVADQIARLQSAPTELEDAARKARSFAAEHAFEKTFRRRAEHLIQLSRLGAG